MLAMIKDHFPPFQCKCHHRMLAEPLRSHRSLLWNSWLTSRVSTSSSLQTFTRTSNFRKEIANNGSRVDYHDAADRNQKLRSLPSKGFLSNALLAPSRENYISLLQLCLRTKALADAKEVYAHIVRNGVKVDEVLGELLVNTLVKCGSLSDALELFSRLSQRTVFAWTVLIAECSKTGQYEKALSIYRQMQAEGLEPNEYTLVGVLKACANLANVDEGEQAHVEAVQRGYGANLFVSNALIAMYSNCGRVVDAKHVFDKIPNQDLVAWNTMISGYAQHKLSKEALQLYIQMQEQGITPDARTYVALLQACAAMAAAEADACNDLQAMKVAALQLGKCVHAEVLRSGFLSNEFITSSLVHLYATCGSLNDARRMFDALAQCNVASWTAMIAAHAQENQGDGALQLYLQMQNQAVRPNDMTFVSVLKACSGFAAAEGGTFVDGRIVKVDSLAMGRELHSEVSRRGYVSDMFVNSSLVNMYANCGSLVDAEIVFNSLTWPDVVSWTAMIKAYAQKGQAERALQLYDQMHYRGMRPNNWTLVSMLKACATLAPRGEDNPDAQPMKDAALYKGKLLHAVLVKRGYESDGFVGNALVHMYASCGSSVDALHVFSTVSTRDVVSWTSMIGAYVQEQDKAWELYTQMKKEGLRPNEATFLCILKVCSSAGALQWCSQIHHDIVESAIVCTGNLVTALMHTYAKCGDMVAAQALFDSLPQPDVVSWTTLIAGYARRGDPERSLQLYSKMQEACIKPNGLTFISILAACSHTGLVEKGMQYFESMTQDHGINATAEHYACMVDLLGRAGMLDRVQDLLSQMPLQQDLAIWSSLLGACRKHMNFEVRSVLPKGQTYDGCKDLKRSST